MFKIEKPWGNYVTLYTEKNYLIKKIIVNPNSKLSLQSHNHRSEYWTVMSGTGKCIIGETIIDVSEGINIFIPQNVKHRLINNSDNELIIIEIQKGNIISEDDIIRYADDYKRD